MCGIEVAYLSFLLLKPYVHVYMWSIFLLQTSFFDKVQNIHDEHEVISRPTLFISPKRLNLGIMFHLHHVFCYIYICS